MLYVIMKLKEYHGKIIIIYNKNINDFNFIKLINKNK